MKACKILSLWSHPPGSNRRPADYESAALPTELGWPDVFTVTFSRRVPPPDQSDSTALELFSALYSDYDFRQSALSPYGTSLNNIRGAAEARSPSSQFCADWSYRFV